MSPYPPPNGSKGSGVADLELVGESAGSKCLDLMANGSETVPGSVRQTILADVGHSASLRLRLSHFERWRVVGVGQALGGALARAAILWRALTSKS